MLCHGLLLVQLVHWLIKEVGLMSCRLITLMVGFIIVDKNVLIVICV